MQKISHSIVIASDCHFYSAEEPKAQIFLQTIKKFDLQNLEYFILLGDIFDFCFGASDYFRNKFKPFHECFRYLRDHDVKVVFLQGNHEFSFEEIKWPEVEIITGLEKMVTLNDGTNFILTHGDRLLAPPSYFWYLKITRSKLFSFIARLLPQEKLDKLALWISRKSRNTDKYRVLDHDRVLESVNRWLETHPSNHGIFGHFHHPYFEERKDGLGKIVSLASWHHPNFLGYNEGTFFRILPHENGFETEEL